MSTKGKTIFIVSICLILIGLAVLVWANQTNRITIWGDQGCGCGYKCTTHCSGWNTIGDATNGNSPYKCCLNNSLCDDTEDTTSVGLFCVPIPTPTPTPTTVTAIVSPTTWTTSAAANSGFVETQFEISTSVTPASITCDKAKWTAIATSDNDKLKIRNSIYEIGSAWGINDTGDQLPNGSTCATIPENVSSTLSAGFDTTGLSAGDYTASINFTSAFLTYTSTPITVPVTIKITAAPVVDTQAPTTPTNLTGTAISCTQINLSWAASTDNVGVTGYEIYNADNNQLLGTTTGATTWSFINATCANTYRFYVKALDAAGNKSEKSNIATVTTPSAAINTNTNTTQLVSTGQALWFNILIALIISGIISFLILRKKEQ